MNMHNMLNMAVDLCFAKLLINQAANLFQNFTAVYVNTV